MKDRILRDLMTSNLEYRTDVFVSVDDDLEYMEILKKEINQTKVILSKLDNNDEMNDKEIEYIEYTFESLVLNCL